MSVCAETGQFRTFGYNTMILRYKESLTIFWLRRESLEDSGDLPAPELIATEIVEDVPAALDQFGAIAASVGVPSPGVTSRRSTGQHGSRRRFSTCPDLAHDHGLSTGLIR
jgi:hypothetical protein